MPQNCCRWVTSGAGDRQFGGGALHGVLMGTFDIGGFHDLHAGEQRVSLNSIVQLNFRHSRIAPDEGW